MVRIRKKQQISPNSNNYNSESWKDLNLGAPDGAMDVQLLGDLARSWIAPFFTFLGAVARPRSHPAALGGDHWPCGGGEAAPRGESLRDCERQPRLGASTARCDGLLMAFAFLSDSIVLLYLLLYGGSFVCARLRLGRLWNVNGTVVLMSLVCFKALKRHWVKVVTYAAVIFLCRKRCAVGKSMIYMSFLLDESIVCGIDFSNTLQGHTCFWDIFFLR